MAFNEDYAVLQTIFQKIHIVKAAWVKHYEDFTVLNGRDDKGIVALL